MRITPTTPCQTLNRRASDNKIERRSVNSGRRLGDRRGASTTRQSQERARHSNHQAHTSNLDNQWISPVFAAHIIGQHTDDTQTRGNAINANRAYDKVVNPYLRPLHTRTA